MGLAALALAACGGSGGGSGGTSTSPPPPPAPTLTTIDVVFSADDVVSGSDETGTASGDVTYNETDDSIEVTVTLSGITAETVTLRDGLAGTQGDERFPLEAGSGADEWVLATTSLAAADINALESGALYLLLTTTAAPEGALRGQIVPGGISVERFPLESRQVTSNSTSPATGKAWATVDDSAGTITVHVVTNGLDDADAAGIHEALAGEDGPSVAVLAQDPNDAAHWLLDAMPYTTALQDAAAAGALYVTLSSQAHPAGAIRGQFIPDGLELVITELDSDDVVMGAAPPVIGKARPATLLGRMMTTLGNGQLTSHVNLFAVPDVDTVELRRAPAGQNGPVVAGFDQDPNDPDRWSLPDHPVDAVLQAGLDNQSLYVHVATPGAPEGVARGQILTAASMLPPDDGAFVVESVDPPNAATVTSLPQTVVATLNRAALPESVSPQSVLVEASGQDGSFGDGNETPITPASVGADGDDINISLAGVQAEDDVYRVSLFGSGNAAIVDMSGIALDGDQDGEPGGTFETAFELASPPPAEATFTEIQNSIFTMSCALSGCHTGANPPDGLNLSAGNAYANIVNVASVQMPSLFRIEPGDPDDSYLVRKVEGVGIVANRMPLDAPPLTQEQIDLIRQWVSDGAPDN